MISNSWKFPPQLPNFAKGPKVIKAAVKTDAAPSAIGPYSQAIRIENTVYCSGQIPLNPQTGELFSGSISEETHLVMKNLMAVLEAAGCTQKDVVKTTIFLHDMEHFAEVNEAYGSYFSEPYPARACIQAAKLPKDVRIEIDAIANVSDN